MNLGDVMPSEVSQDTKGQILCDPIVFNGHRVSVLQDESPGDGWWCWGHNSVNVFDVPKLCM